jgi:L-arabinose isomerase
MRLNRKVVVGHYLDPESVHRIAVWVRVATAYDDARSMKVARFGDNMRDVTVTEGNKVSAQIKMGYSVYGYGTGDLVRAVNDVSPNAIKKLLTEYASEYKMTKAVAGSETLREAARIELGNRFRMIVNVVEVVKCPDMPQLPVASVLWKPMPDLKTGAAAWILAGGAHHTGFSTAINAEYLEDFSEMMGIEFVIINEKCNLTTLKNELRWNEVYYHLAGGIN